MKVQRDAKIDVKALFEKIEKKVPVHVEGDRDEAEGEAEEVVDARDEEQQAKVNGAGEEKVGAVRRGKASLSKAVQAINQDRLFYDILGDGWQTPTPAPKPRQ